MDGTAVTRVMQVKRGMRATRRLKRPDGITQRQWPTVKDVLVAYASYLPNIEVAQERVAKRCGRSLNTVKRATALAVKVGLLEVAPAGHHRVNHVILSYLTSTHYESLSGSTHNEPLIGTPNGVPMVPSEPSAPPHRATSTRGEPLKTLPPAATSPPRETAAMVTFGELADEPLVGRIVAGGRLNARTLVRHFEDRWLEIRAAKAKYANSRVRGVDTQAGFGKYLRSTFLAEDAKYHKTPEEVLALMDAFLDDVGTKVEPKESHALWRLFATRWHEYKPAATVTRSNERVNKRSLRYLAEARGDGSDGSPDPA